MYQAFYKLHGKPFQLTPDPAMLFPSKGHRRAMSYLRYGLEQGEGFVMITGAVGAGKTLLIQKLSEELAHLNITVASVASANLDSEDILPAVVSALGLAHEGRGKETLLQGLKQHLVSLRDRNERALLVVDEAQTLTPAALEMLRILSNLELAGRALLQIFLVGQTELRRIITSNHMEQLRQRIIASYRLEPMDEEESRAYVLYRLQAAGWNNDPELAPEIFASVYRASCGVPRKINLIMDRLLLYGYLEELHSLDQAALAIVLDEIHDEMGDVQATLEPSAVPPRPSLQPASAAFERDSGFAALDLKTNDILLRLMRETLRLRSMLRADRVSVPVTDEVAAADTLRPRPAQEGEDG